MGAETILLIITLCAGFYMAWSIGANDVANAMGTSVGSGALTLKQAVICAAILEFAGAFLVGTSVSETVRKGIVDTSVFMGEPMLLVYGMIGALLAAGVWLQFASYYGWPVSTTHSIVGAIIGFGAVVGGVEAVNWSKVGTIVSSWVVSPVLSGTIAFLIFSLLRRKIFNSRTPVEQAKKITPYLVFFVFAILTLVMVFKGLKNLKLDLPLTEAILVASLTGLVAAIISYYLVQRIKTDMVEDTIQEYQSPAVMMSLSKTEKHLLKLKSNLVGEEYEQVSKMIDEMDEIKQKVSANVKPEREITQYKKVEKIFVYLQILSACFVAFAHGANDVANSIGPLSAALHVLKTGTVVMKTTVPIWVLGLGGVGIVIGLATWGWRVIETIGKRITELTPTRGFCAEFAAATTIVLASKLGLPISTTHTLVGAVLGVGLARGMGALNISTVRDIAISWVVTIPAGAGLAITFFYIFKGVFG